MSDAITIQCEECGEDFDYLPWAGLPKMCDECDEKLTKFNQSIGLLRQWLNENKITDPKKMVTDEELKEWFK